MNGKKIILVVVLAAILTAILLIVDSASESAYKYLEYKEFNKALVSGDIATANISYEKVYYTLRNASGDFYTDNPETNNFKEVLLLNGVSVTKDDSEDLFTNIMDVTIYIFFFGAIIIAAVRFKSMFNGDNFKVIRNNKTKFSDICGMKELKADMTKTVDLLKNAEAYREKGIRAPKGIILEGPPGNGKTLFAKALAGEANMNFIATKGADFQSAVMSIGPSKIKALFKKARRNKPCIVFIDEFDGIGERRSYAGTGIDKENNRIITAMLNEMDGFVNDDGVLVIGATNSYASLDAALIRPGRFDRKFNIGLPNEETISELITLYTKNKKLDDSLKVENLVKLFKGLSCSSIETIINEAAFEATKNNRDAIKMEDIIAAGNKTNTIHIR